MLSRASLLVSLAVVVGSSPANAASRTAKNRCSDAVMILRSNPSKFYERESVDPLDTSNATKHRAQAIDGITRAKAKIAQVPTGEFDEADPELAECVGELRAWEAYITVLDTKLAIATEQGKVFVPFLAEVKKYDPAFLAFLSIAADPKTRYLDNKQPADLRGAYDELASVEAACAKIPAEYREPPADYDGKTPVVTLMKRPFAWCRIAKRRTELATAYLANKTYHAEGYGHYSLLIPETIEKLESGKGFMEAWMAAIVLEPQEFKAAVRAAAASWYRAMDIAMPAGPMPEIDGLVERLRARVDEVAPTQHFEKGPRDGAIEKGAQSSLLAIYPKATVLAFAMDADGYTLRVTRKTEQPKDLFRSGQVMFKVPGTQHCMQRTFSYSETHIGGGKFQKPSRVNILPATRFLSCK